MHKASRFLAGLSIVALCALSTGVSHAANATGCTPSGALKVKHTAAGSCKDPSHGWNIHCGSTGVVTTAVFGIFANAANAAGNAIDTSDPTKVDPTKIDGFQVEACSDSGNGDTQGRLMLQGSAAGQGVRAILDSDPDQAFPAGWDLAEVGAQAQGVFCLKKNGTGDGYQQPWNITGPETGAPCIQNLSPASRANYGHMFDAAAAALIVKMPQMASKVAQLRTMLAL